MVKHAHVTNRDLRAGLALDDTVVRVVVLDVVMPKKNGYQVCRQLKTTAATQGIKVLLLTSKNQESDRFWGLKQGADAYLTKPFVGDELLASVTKLI